jgi:hypothetical protein
VPSLLTVEDKGATDKELARKIEEVLADAPRVTGHVK